MFNAGVLTFREFVMHERVTLAQIQEFILTSLRGRVDTVVFGAQAVNAYVSEPRMTQDIDLLSIRAADFSEELRESLSQKFEIAVRIREIADGKGFRIYQVQKTGNRHLVDIRSVTVLPQSQIIADIQVLTPAELIASKVISHQARSGKPKAGTDWRDLTMLLLEFPLLKTKTGAVFEILQKANVSQKVLDNWSQFVEQNILIEDEDEDLSF